MRQKFNPDEIWGRAIAVDTLDLDDKNTALAIKRLTDTAKREFPKGTPFEIRAGYPGCPNQISAVALFYSPLMDRTIFNHNKWVFDVSIGCNMLGRFLT